MEFFNDMKSAFYYFVVAIFVTLLLSSCTPTVRFSTKTSTSISKETTVKQLKGTQFKGLASYYHDKFVGRQTASGEIFNQKLYTAAHKELPFGTLVRVTRTSNGKTVTVRINDRGPFVAGRIIDLTYTAALELDLIKDGVAEVIIEILD